tara:strand:+ start:5428 stop:5715 length:288 start_codon:yes stop_codon:yes gene_type:complete
MTINEPEVEKYGEEIPKIIFGLYKTLKVGSEFKLDIDFFRNESRARAVIKKFMDRGAYIFCSFRSDFKELRIKRNADTDGYIKKHKEEQIQRQED